MEAADWLPSPSGRTCHQRKFWSRKDSLFLIEGKGAVAFHRKKKVEISGIAEKSLVWVPAENLTSYRKMTGEESEPCVRSVKNQNQVKSKRKRINIT